MRQNQTDFTVAKQWTEDDVQTKLIDLSVARNKPEALGLGGKNIFVSSKAWDDNNTFSTTKTVGEALAYINSNNGNPIELVAGISYEEMGVFDDIYIRNVAQAGKMLKIIVTNETKVKPFTSELKVLGGDPSLAGISIADVSCPATSTTLVLAANPNRKNATISNIASNGTVLRCGDSSIGASRGNEIPNGASAVVQGNDAIYIYNPLATSIVVGITYDEA